MTQIIHLNNSSFGSGYDNFHRLGWIEGYIEILRQYLFFKDAKNYPNLTQHLITMNSLLKSN